MSDVGLEPCRDLVGGRHGLDFGLHAPCPSANDGSSRTRLSASRTTSAVNSSGFTTTPAPTAAQRAALSNWSAPWGTRTSGKPSASAPRTLPEPPWLTTAAQRGNTCSCGTKRSTRTFGGRLPSDSGSTLRPVVTSADTDPSSPSSNCRRTSGLLNTVPRVTYTSGCSSSSSHAGASSCASGTCPRRMLSPSGSSHAKLGGLRST